MTTITFAKTNNSVLTRKDLKPGTVFVYSQNATLVPQLFLVPDPAFSRHPNITEKDIVIGGRHSGTLDDCMPACAVAVVDLTASLAKTSINAPLREVA